MIESCSVLAIRVGSFACRDDSVVTVSTRMLVHLEEILLLAGIDELALGLFEVLDSAKRLISTTVEFEDIAEWLNTLGVDIVELTNEGKSTSEISLEGEHLSFIFEGDHSHVGGEVHVFEGLRIGQVNLNHLFIESIKRETFWWLGHIVVGLCIEIDIDHAGVTAARV